MFKIHKKIKYALLALKYMSAKTPDELTTAKEICSSYRIPFDPTSRVLQIMTQNGILKAEQGAYGGYRITGELPKISLYALSHMIIGPVAVTDCCNDRNQCARESDCVLKEPMGRLNARMLKVFKEIRITEMI